MTSTANPGGPLKGIRVLDLSINVLGPLSCQLLADMGAEVIKVEGPQGDPQRTFGASLNPGMSAFYINLNRGKRSIVLDLKKADAREALMTLIDGADVLVHSMRIKAAERLGIGWEQVHARNPRLVYACGTGYSQQGPRRDRAAYDDAIQGEAGIADLCLRANGRPGYIPMPFADKFCAYVQSSAIGMALYARERSGVGQAVYTPMMESLVAFGFVEHLWGATYDPPVSPPGYPRMFIEHRRPFQTADGYVCLLAHTDEQWQRLFDVIGRPDLAADARFATLASRSVHVEALYGQLSERLQQDSTAHWCARLDAADLPNAPMATLDSVLGSEYLNQTGFISREQHPTEGSLVRFRQPVEFSATPTLPPIHAPQLGEHTQEVLRAAGYSDPAIAAMTTRKDAA